jgi:hypothetical protein
VRRAGLIAACLALSPCAATPAWGATANCQAPPGTSAVDQYCETIPAPGGDRGSSDRTGRRTGSSLTPGTARTLGRAGTDGRGILSLPAGAPPAHARRHAPALAPPKPAPASESPFSAIGSAVDAGGSLGSGFMWVLIALGIGFVGAAWMRYRRPHEG